MQPDFPGSSRSALGNDRVTVPVTGSGCCARHHLISMPWDAGMRPPEFNENLQNGADSASGYRAVPGTSTIRKLSKC